MATSASETSSNFWDQQKGNKAVTNDTEKKTIDLSSHELDSFCLKSFSHITWNLVTDLDLAFNNISTLPPELLQLSSLQTLDVSGNVLDTLPECLTLLSSLTSLKANESCIHVLPETLGKLKRLKYLSVVGNALGKLSDSFNFPENLEKLHLDECQLKCLPSSLCHLSQLKVLEASSNSLQELPVNFGKMCSLEVINLSHNEVSELPQSFAELKNLTLIDISHNKLSTLTSSLASAEKLKFFYAGHNQLEILPPWTSKLKSIETYSVKDNTLLGEPFEDEFCENAKGTLKVFELGGNFIECLPSSLGLLSKVEFFHIGSILPEIERRDFQNGNWILDLPENFGGMVSLTKLRLDENQFDRLPDSFGDLVNLEFLDLGQNRLRYLPDSFCNLRSLKTCLLSKNCLLELPREFGNLCQLTQLLLDSNQLKDLPQSFCKLTTLKYLDLFDNQLCNIPDCLQYLQQLRALDLDWNNFEVDYLDVPRISQANYYSSNRKKFGPGSNQDTNGVSALAIALQNRRALWARHGETGERQGMQRAANSNLQENGISSLSLTDSKERHNVKLENGYPDVEDWDKEVEDSPNGEQQNANPQDGNPQEAEEDWDKEVEDSPYDDENFYQHPTSKDLPRGEPAVNFYFLPSEEHASEVPPTTFDTDVSEGQFDDAD